MSNARHYKTALEDCIPFHKKQTGGPTAFDHNLFAAERRGRMNVLNSGLEKLEISESPKAGRLARPPYSLAGLITLLLLLVSCSGNDGLTLEQLTVQLLAGKGYPADVEFTKREFIPYLNGEWIGNAVSYGPYRKGQAPGVNGPSEAEILEDLQLISRHWNLIRVYASDDDSERVLKVLRDNELPIKVMLGVWLENETDKPARREQNIKQVLRGIELANEYPELLAAINVGNETQVFWSGHRMLGEDLIRYVRAVRKHTLLPVTVADDYNFWNKPESKALAAEVDLIVCHMYAMWNGKTLDNAIVWTDSTYRAIRLAYPEHAIVLGETGWATIYNAEKTGPDEQGTLIKGEVSVRAQGEFLIALDKWIEENQVTTFLFEAFDEPWKGGGEASGPNEVEKHWGVFFEDRTPKPSFERFLNQ
ncbi:MAG: glycosyl hydrolase family 17 [Calditrichia bacterium]